MEVIKEELDAELKLDEIKEFRKVRRADHEYSEYVKCRTKGLDKEASAFVCELGSAYLDNSVKLLSIKSRKRLTCSTANGIPIYLYEIYLI